MLAKCFKELSLFLEYIRIPPHLECMLAVKDGSTLVGCIEGVRQKSLCYRFPCGTLRAALSWQIKPILRRGGEFQQMIERFLKWLHAQWRHNLMCSVFIWLSYECYKDIPEQRYRFEKKGVKRVFEWI